MNRNLEIHDEFKNMGELNCPFCDEQMLPGKQKQALTVFHLTGKKTDCIRC